MANPTVEKLKEVGLLYGDKAAVALTSVLFVVCLGAALSKKSIELTPEQVKTSARIGCKRHTRTAKAAARNCQKCQHTGGDSHTTATT